MSEARAQEQGNTVGSASEEQNRHVDTKIVSPPAAATSGYFSTQFATLNAVLYTIIGIGFAIGFVFVLPIVYKEVVTGYSGNTRNVSNDTYTGSVGFWGACSCPYDTQVKELNTTLQSLNSSLESVTLERDQFRDELEAARKVFKSEKEELETKLTNSYKEGVHETGKYLDAVTDSHKTAVNAQEKTIKMAEDLIVDKDVQIKNVKADLEAIKNAVLVHTAPAPEGEEKKEHDPSYLHDTIVSTVDRLLRVFT